MSESRIKRIKRIARIFESVLSFNPRQSAILTMRGLGLWRNQLSNRKGSWVK